MILSGLYISKEILLDSGLVYHLFYALLAITTITTITINVQKQSWCFCVFKDQHSANSCHIRRRKAIQEREKCYTILNSGLAIVKFPTKAQSAFIYNIDSSTTEKVVSYYAIDVTNGDKLTGLVEDLDEVAAPTYPLYLNDESTPLVPRITQDNAAVTEYNVAVTVSGNGKAYGNGTYVNGTFAKVVAATDGDEKFQGWYLDDSLVSTEGEYRFLVDKDISLVAKFGESPSADTYALTVVDGTGSGSYESGAQISITANSVRDCDPCAGCGDGPALW